MWCAYILAGVGCSRMWSLEVAVWNHPDTLPPYSLRQSLLVQPRAAHVCLPVQSALRVLSPSSMSGVPGKLPGPLALKDV